MQWKISYNSFQVIEQKNKLVVNKNNNAPQSGALLQCLKENCELSV